MVEILERYGGWPVVKGNSWNEENWKWMEAHRNISNDGLDDTLLFALAILTDQKNSSRRILDVSADLVSTEIFSSLGIHSIRWAHFSWIKLTLDYVWNFWSKESKTQMSKHIMILWLMLL